MVAPAGRRLRAGPLAALLAACLASPASAVFFKTQMDRIDPEPLFDSEYFLDLVGFREPLEWEDLWRASTGPAYRVTGASLDCCTLLLRQELVFPKQLTPNLGFRYQLVHSEDKDRQEIHQWLSFERRLPAGFSVLAFGEPTFNKEDADIGLGLGYRRGRWSGMARRNFVDFNLNGRGNSGQSYDRLPITDDLRVRGAFGAQSVDLWLEVDHPLSRRVPADELVFRYRRTTAAAEWSRRPPGGWGQRARYAYEYHAKGNVFSPDPNARSLLYRRQVHAVYVATEGPVGEKDRLEAGHALLVRAARDDNPGDSRQGVFYRRWESQPYLRWRRRLSRRLTSDVAPSFSFGEDRRRFPGGAQAGVFDGIIEAKIGAGLDVVFTPSARIGFYTSFDIDEARRHFWDGGAARLLFLF